MTEVAAAQPNRTRLVAGLSGVLGVGAAGLLGLAWWLGFLTPEPDPVVVTDAAASVTDEANGAVTAPIESVSSIESLTGEWMVEPSEATFIGYRADSNVGEAVGRSPAVTGTLTATETEITSVSITGDMTQLVSDSDLRDSHLGDEGIETDRYPTATFALTEPILIEATPDAGVEQTFTAIGELTVKEITRPITIELQAVVVDDKFVVAGDSDLALGDFGAEIGSTTEAVMEFSLVFSR